MFRILSFLIIITANCYSLDWLKEDVAKTNQLQLLYLHANWCGPCKTMQKEGFTDPEIIRLLEKFYLLKHEESEELGSQLLKRYHLVGFPTLIVFNQKGKELRRLLGYSGKPKLAEFLNKSLLGLDELKELQEKVKKERFDLKTELSLLEVYLQRNYFNEVHQGVKNFIGDFRFLDSLGELRSLRTRAYIYAKDYKKALTFARAQFMQADNFKDARAAVNLIARIYKLTDQKFDKTELLNRAKERFNNATN